MFAQRSSYIVSPNVGDNNGSEVPTGTVFTFAGATAPAGWLMCDGSAVSRATYADLFALIGTTYGAGNGTTTFNVPNTQNRTIRGKGTSVFATLGNTGGNHAPTITATQSLTIAAANLPQHRHGYNLAAGTGYVAADGVNGNRAAQTANVTSANSTYNETTTTPVPNTPLAISAVATSQSVVNQFIVLNYIIKD